MLGQEEDSVLRLVEEIQAGVRVDANFEELYRRFRPAVRSYFKRKGFSGDESLDLTQDVFSRVFRRIYTFRRESRFERWLWEIVVNVYFNEVRRRRTEKRMGTEESLDGPSNALELGSEEETHLGIPADEVSPEDFLLWRERQEELRSAFRSLPVQMRRCVILRYERGLKYRDIADIMKISIETVKAHLHQARKRLISELGG